MTELDHDPLADNDYICDVGEVTVTEPTTQAGRAHLKARGENAKQKRAAILAIEAEAVAPWREALLALSMTNPVDAARCWCWYAPLTDTEGFHTPACLTARALLDKEPQP